MLRTLLNNHVLANLMFALVLILGSLVYMTLPREQDPTINFNWIDITTIYPGASAEDVEKRVTDVLEDAVQKLSDVRFVSSTSRESTSNIVVRFNEIDSDVFDKRVNDLRREIQNTEAELPDAVLDPVIFEVTSANAFPTATIVVYGLADSEHLRSHAQRVNDELERMKDVDRVLTTALPDPEMIVRLHPQRLESLGLSPADVAHTIQTYFRDVAAGSIDIDDERWLVRLLGTSPDPEYLADITLPLPGMEVRLGDVADIERSAAEARRKVRYKGHPAVMLSVTKKADANIIDLVERLHTYTERFNSLMKSQGVFAELVDDQTQVTRDALRVMQTNAALGLSLVLVVTWLFLGMRIAVLTCIGIPFILAGTFLVLKNFDQTLNVSVLLGIVISLGMLVDDAVVVVESIYYRLQRGYQAFEATVAALSEVSAPVTTAVLTTMAAFLPLMLLPGILGQFMLVIPLVVTVALAISLIEAFWMLPVHITSMRIDLSNPGWIQRMRVRFLHSIRVLYTRMLIRVFRHPWVSAIAIVLMISGSIGAVAMGTIRLDFFASDPLRLFYVNIEMPGGSRLESTMDKVSEVEAIVRRELRGNEVRSVVSYAGQTFTEIEPLFGDHYGQILVSLKPTGPGIRSVDEIIESLRPKIERIPGPKRLTFLRLAGGPPISKPINIKVRGDDFDAIRSAVAQLREFLANKKTVFDLGDDEEPGQQELRLRVDFDALARTGVDPSALYLTLRILVDGEVLTSFQDRGEKVEVRLKSAEDTMSDINSILETTLPGRDNQAVPLSTLLKPTYQRGQGNIRHYDFRRAITLSADIDKEATDTVAINNEIRAFWETINDRHSGIDLDFTGVLDDIEESLDAIGMLFLFGVGLIYLILGTQFKSYFQPIMILSSIPLAFTGVVLGLIISDNPLSLFTLYGVVALAGISVNSAIVLISAANIRLDTGYTVIHAILYAARRRVVPILITSLTTIAGLLSLATGLGGKSLLWGPVATSIVWGLSISSLLTLFFVPLLYRIFMGRSHRRVNHGLKRIESDLPRA
ncbi:MAG: acriflavin resistance protein [marine bacterium B5-7]|nr:MAG: acriflavin resistance protein [marine bacterium B5-7]